MSKVDHEVLEDLLSQASPRPAPGADDVAAAKAAVREEWMRVAAKHRGRRRVVQYAMAATVLLAAFAGLNVLRSPVDAAVRVASIERSFGPVYLLGDQAELRPTDDLANINTGQTIVTGDESGLALTWGTGGSVRIDANSRVTFTASDALFLESGRVYFDSQTAALAAGAGAAPRFVVGTEQGRVHHLGTQFMTESGADRLVVSVREGRVNIEGVYHGQQATAGEQVTLAGRQQPSVLRIERSGAMWNWVERTTPAVDVDGKTLHEFLLWACREMGLELRYEGKAEAAAHQAVLKGSIDTEPGEALGLRLETAALDWRIEQGVIYISD